jgi:nucleotide-binding universal stress UspA family protein
MKTVLCSIDLSAFSPAVLCLGAGLARRFEARLMVFHSVYSADDPTFGNPLFEHGGELKRRTADALDRIQALMEHCPVDWQPLIRPGEPVAALAQTAAQTPADLVVVASHGFGGLKRLLLGRVVERMVRMVPTPFLVVRGQTASRSPAGCWEPPAFQRILIGCGLASDFQPAVEWGLRLAGRFGAEATVLHAMESPAPEKEADAPEGSYAQIEQERQADRRRRLQRLIALLAGASRSAVETVLAQGPPGDALLEQARRQVPDMVVVGVRRQSGIRRVLIGSTTEILLRRSPCPVLAIPEPGLPADSGREALAP